MRGAPLAKPVINVFAQEKQLAEATEHIWQGAATLILPATLLLHPPPLPVTSLSPSLEEINTTSVLASSV